jgi:chloramphenicol-sensitive protein RarD
MTDTSKGFATATAAFALWGVFPLYFHTLQDVSAFQVIAHRVLWSCLFLLLWMGVRGELTTLRVAMTSRSVIGRLVVTATLITINWTVYVWAVINGRVVEASLGYFTGPLVNVLLGVVLLSEKLTRAQWTAITLAAAGVIYLTVMTGSPPWIALTLAFSFGTYGLMRKVVKVEALPGLAVETLVLVPFAVAYLLWCEAAGTGALGHAGIVTDALLIGSGPLTAIGLFLFAYGTRRLPYSTVGVLQYIAPTGQLICGVFAFHEPFERVRLTGFALIWAALLLYATEGLRLSRKQQRAFA